MHPASQLPFDQLIAGLELEVEGGYVRKKQAENLTLYNYNEQCTFQKRWNVFTESARGLIVDEKRVVAFPFPKFFNHGEFPFQNKEIHSITEKMDGSLGIIFWHNNCWQVATRGSFTSKQSDWARKRLDKYTLTPGITYLCEIIYPENRVVIDYKEEKLILLGAYDEKGSEIINLDQLSKQTGLELVASHCGTVENILQLCKTLPGTREGFVVRFVDGTRLKYKGTSYLELHRIASNFAPIHVWEKLKDGINWKPDLPEEFYADYDKWEAEFTAKYNELLANLAHLLESVKDKSNKEIGQATNLDSYQKQIIFMSQKMDAKEPGKLRNVLFGKFMPSENKK